MATIEPSLYDQAPPKMLAESTSSSTLPPQKSLHSGLPMTHKLLVAALAIATLAGCQKEAAAPPAMVAAAPVPAVSPYRVTASIQELMDALVDPSADELWESVATITTSKGVEERRPRTDEEWTEQRRHAVALMEATNLLAMPGRKLVPVGGKILDQDIQGVLTPEEGQKKLDEQHDAFVGFAHSLNDVGAKMLAAIDAKNPQGIMDAGAEMDAVCEGCHMTFWYPNQVIPQLPADVPPTTRQKK
jgi:hypothetical protein